jgi:hypothetical protein
MELSVAAERERPMTADSPGTYTPWFQDHDGVLHLLDSLYRHRVRRSAPVAGRTWTHTTITKLIVGAHAVEFSKTVEPHPRGFLF